MRLKTLFKYLFFLLSGIIVFLALCPTYLQQGLIHWYADLDDYKIFVNDTIENGTSYEWQIADNYNQYKLSDTDRKYHEEHETVAFLVIQNDKILYEEYWDGYGEESYSNMFSVTKSIISLLVGIAIDEGFIDSVNEPIGKYIPEFANDDRGKITIKNLLTMSSGLDWDEAYTSPFSITTKGYYGTKLREISTSQQFMFEPGTIHNYQSGTTQLLAFVVEEAIGKSLNEYAAEKIWKPIGAKHPALWSIDKENGDERAFCCIFTNARDIARIAQLILNKGRWNGKQIVPETYIKKAIQPASYLLDIDTNKPLDFYGWQFWILNYKDQKIPYMRGHLGQYIYAVPDSAGSSGTVIVRLGKKKDTGKKGPITLDIEKYVEMGLKILN